MKKIILLFLVCYSFSFAQDKTNVLVKTANYSSLTAKDLKGFKVNEDKFGNIITIEPKSPYKDLIYPYIVISDNVAVLFLNVGKRSKRTLFLETFKINFDGQTYAFPILESFRSYSGGYTTETSAIVVDIDLYQVLNQIRHKDQQIDIRFEGTKYFDDAKISKGELKIIDNVLNLYDKL